MGARETNEPGVFSRVEQPHDLGLLTTHDLWDTITVETADSRYQQDLSVWQRHFYRSVCQVHDAYWTWQISCLLPTLPAAGHSTYKDAALSALQPIPDLHHECVRKSSLFDAKDPTRRGSSVSDAPGVVYTKRPEVAGSPINSDQVLSS
ncbi:MAG: hypothetical protein NVSMB62_15410 [Acidobacteriaceae bacterium]